MRMSIVANFDCSAPLTRPFTGAFTALLPGAFQLVQTDLGFTYGATLRAAGTTPPVVALTGALNAALVPVPILVTCTSIGALGVWTGSVSYDNGSTQSQTFTSAATVPLTGTGLGLSLSIAAGTAALNNTWQATCAGLADQTSNGWNFAQASAALQPIVTVGVNGKPGLLFTAASSSFLLSAFNPPNSAVTPFTIYAVFKPTANAAQQTFFGALGAALLFDGSTNLTQIQAYNGAAANLTTGASVQSRVYVDFTNSVSDRIKFGASSVATGANALNGVGTSGMAIGDQGAAGQPANMELLMFAIAPRIMNPQSAAIDTALNSTLGYGLGNIAV